MNRKHTKELLESLVKESTSIKQVIEKLGLKLTGGNSKNIKERCIEFNIDLSHFTGQGWKKLGHPSYEKDATPIDDFFILSNKKKSSTKVKQRLLNNNIREHKCEKCNNKGEWLGNKLTIELHHLNGNNLDNRLVNLQLLCPNCHSQTFNYCRRKELLK